MAELFFNGGLPMTRLRMMLTAFFIVPLVSAVSAGAGGATCRLVRSPRPADGVDGLIRPAVSETSTKDDFIWHVVVQGFRLTFTIRRPGGSFFATMDISIDEGEPIQATGSMTFGDAKETINFAPVRLEMGRINLPILARLERYRHVQKERADPTAESGPETPWYMNNPPNIKEHPRAIEVPYVSGWEMFIGNAEVFSGQCELRGRRCRLRLIDADLDGVFGESAGKNGDLLAWEYGEGEGYLGIGGTRRGSAPLAEEITIAGNKYAIRLAPEGPDAFLMELTR